MKYGFYLLTRFNIPVKWGGNADIITNEVYLSERFRLFDKYTWPSVTKQSFQNFEWFVFFSNKTPEIFLKKIESYGAMMKHFHAVFVSDKEARNFSAKLENIFSKQKEDFFVTVRLDNDDAIALTYMEEIASLVEEKNINMETIIYCPQGIQYNEKSNIATKYYYPDNHFIALVYPGKDAIKTALHFNHINCHLQNNAVCLCMRNRKPAWMEVLHLNNAENYTHQTIFNIVNSYEYIDIFGIEISWTNVELMKGYFICFLEPFHRLIIVLKRNGIVETARKLFTKLVFHKRRV